MVKASKSIFFIYFLFGRKNIYLFQFAYKQIIKDFIQSKSICFQILLPTFIVKKLLPTHYLPQ